MTSFDGTEPYRSFSIRILSDARLVVVHHGILGTEIPARWMLRELALASTRTVDLKNEEISILNNELKKESPRKIDDDGNVLLVSGSIYLACSKAHDFTKIGFSSNPSLREGTLQAEDPQLKFLFVSDPKFTRNDEGLIHARFESVRERGEWFALTITEIDDLIKELSR